MGKRRILDLLVGILSGPLVCTPPNCQAHPNFNIVRNPKKLYIHSLTFDLQSPNYKCW